MRKKKQQLSQPQQEQRQYAEITIAALTGEISAEKLFDPPRFSERGSLSHLWSLERVLNDLAEGGFVMDLRPLADHPNVGSWAYQSPMPNGRIDGDEIDRLPDGVRHSAQSMLAGLDGDFQHLAFLAAHAIGEPVNGSAGPFNSVSAAYRAVYWGSRGARIGKRFHNTIVWADGETQAIVEARERNQ